MFITNFISTCYIYQVTNLLVILITFSVLRNYEDNEFLPV
jgi:hypothetical protein